MHPQNEYISYVIYLQVPQLKMPKDFNAALKSSCFKTALAIEWAKDEYSWKIRVHTLFVGLNTKAYL